MDEQNIKLPEPIHVKNIHRKLDLFSENNIIKQWSGHNIVDTFFATQPHSLLADHNS